MRTLRIIEGRRNKTGPKVKMETRDGRITLHLQTFYVRQYQSGVRNDDANILYLVNKSGGFSYFNLLQYYSYTYLLRLYEKMNLLSQSLFYPIHLHHHHTFCFVVDVFPQWEALRRSRNPSTHYTAIMGDIIYVKPVV